MTLCTIIAVFVLNFMSGKVVSFQFLAGTVGIYHGHNSVTKVVDYVFALEK